MLGAENKALNRVLKEPTGQLKKQHICMHVFQFDALTDLIEYLVSFIHVLVESRFLL